MYALFAVLGTFVAFAVVFGYTAFQASRNTSSRR